MTESAKFTLQPDHSWVRPKPKGEWHIGDSETRRTLCERYSEPHDTFGSPDRDEIPPSVCTDCLREAKYLAPDNGTSQFAAKFNVPTPDQFKMLRQRADLTQQQLADRIESSQNTISQYELGNRDIRASTLRDAVKELRAEIL